MKANLDSSHGPKVTGFLTKACAGFLSDFSLAQRLSQAQCNSRLLAIIPFIALSLLNLSKAQAQTIDVKAPQQVSVGQRFQVSWTINGNGSDLKLPDIREFSVLGGPNQSSSISIINGSMSQSLSYSYVLQAGKEGEFTIGAASAKIDGKQVSSKPFTIKVVAGQAQQNPNQQGAKGQQQGAQQAKSGGNDMFARVEVSKRSVNRGEDLYAECKIYSRSQLVHLENYKLPEYTGFWSKDLDMPQQLVVEQEVVDGVAYQVVTLKKTLLYPTKSGKLEIEPMTAEVIVRESSGRQRSIWDMFGGYQDVRKSTTSPKVVIDVRDLPSSGQPATFSGLTGKFNLGVKVDRTTVKAGDAITLKYTISGNGNLYQVQAPSLNFPPDIEAYDPKITDNIQVKASGISGSRTFEYVLIPRYAGSFDLGPFNFSYFDPSANRYANLSEAAISITVEKGEGATEATSPTVNIADKRDIQIIGSDIRYIKQGQYELRPTAHHFFLSGLYWALMLLPIVAGVALMAWHIRREKLAGDVAGSRSRKAKKMAVKRMDGAKRLMGKNDQKGFYEEVAKALSEYVSHRFNIPVADLSRDRMREVFAARNLPQQVSETLIKVIDEAEFARYAPGAAGSMETIYTQALEAIVKTEDHV